MDTGLCARASDGSAACTGGNGNGQVGDGATTDRSTLTAIDTSGTLNGASIIDIQRGGWHTCVTTSTGEVSCWGSNNAGQLGDTTSGNSTTPVSTKLLGPDVSMGGSAATNVTRTSPAAATATTSAHTPGTVHVVTTNQDGQTATLTNGYTYTATVPSAPTSLSTSPSNSSVVLTWVAPGSTGGSSITDYKIEYSPDSGTTWNTFTHAASTATTQTVTSLTPGTTYTFRVSAINAVGTSSPSATATGTPLYITLSSLPTINLNVTPDSAGRISSQANTATVSTNNANGYTLQLSTTSSSRNLTRSGGSETLTPSSGSSGSPGALATNTWGYRVDNTGGFGSGTYLETNVTSSVFTWAGVPGVGSPTTLRTTTSTASNDQTTVWYGMKAASDKPSGNYINTILYTAIVN